MSEIGRAGWFTLGATAMAVAGIAHAVADLGHIAREMSHASPAGDGRATSPRGPAPQAGGMGGWILFSALVLAGGAAYHAIADARDLVKEIAHTVPAV